MTNANYNAVVARSQAYCRRARKISAAVQRAKTRYEDRGAAALLIAENMSKLDVDAPTIAAYREIYTYADACQTHIGTAVSRADALAHHGRALEETTRAQQGRMADLNRTHTTQMGQAAFIRNR